MLAASRSHLPRGAWDLYVDGPDARLMGFLGCLAEQPVPSFCRWNHFRVAEVDGVPAAGLCGYAARDPGMSDPTPAIVGASRAALGWRSDAIATASSRLGAFLTCVVEPSPDAWVVEWVATRPAFRRRGIIRGLLLDVLDVGRRRGHRNAQITVLIGNTAAQCAYERVGFEVVEERRHEDFARALGCPGIARMVRAL